MFRDGVPDDVRGRWRLIREFTERWHGVSVPDIGGRRGEVAAEEARLGLTLPESVREWVAYTRDLRERFPPAWSPDPHARPFWWTAADPGHGPGGEAVCLTHEGRGAAGWSFGVRYDRLRDPDPPMTRYFHFGSPEPPPGPASVSLAAFRMVVGDLLNLGWGLTARSCPGDLFGRLDADFPVRVWFDDADVLESDEVLAFIRPPGSEYGGSPERHVWAVARRPVESVPDYLLNPDEVVVDESGRPLSRMGWLPRWVSVPRRRRTPPL